MLRLKFTLPYLKIDLLQKMYCSPPNGIFLVKETYGGRNLATS